MDIFLNLPKLPPPNNIIISYPKHIGNSLITWDVMDNAGLNEVVSISYNIYRGLSVGSIFYKLNKEKIENNHFEDQTIGKHPNIQYWYKVSTSYLHTNGQIVEGIISNPVTYQVLNTNRWFQKMNDRDLWILKNDAELYDLYTFKNEGKQCPKCYDPIRGSKITSNCDVCFGTGTEFGYEPTFQLYIRRKFSQTDVALANSGLKLNSVPGAWTISTIVLKNRDLIISPQGKFYTVLNSTINHAAGYLFHQELQLKELEPNDPLYNLKRTTLYPNL